MIKEGPDEPYYLGEIEVVDPLGEFLELGCGVVTNRRIPSIS